MSVLLRAISSHPPQKIALIGDKESYSYGDFLSVIEERAVQLKNVRVLAIALDNGPEWLLWDLASVLACVPCVPIPPFFTQEQTAHALQMAGVSHVVSSDGLSCTGHFAPSDLPKGTQKITFTSGTSGNPKGVCLSQKGMEDVARSLSEMLEPNYARAHLAALPLAVLLENVAGVYASFLAGGTVYLPSLTTIGFSEAFAPDFPKLAAYMKKHKIASSIFVPEMLRGLMAQKLRLPDLEFLAVGGAKISPALIETARHMGLPVYEGYGLSECASVVSLNMPGRDKTGSAGQALPHIKLSEKNGEIVIENSAFLGYVGTSHNGAFKTGDLGYIDEEGFVHINGRSKNILITSYGRNISPEWAEAALLAQPEIMQAVVYGEAQAFLSALIVPSAPGADIEGALESANARLPSYARIEHFHLAAPFTPLDGTLTGTGRVRRESIFKKYQILMQKEKNDEFLQETGERDGKRAICADECTTTA